MFQRIRIGVSKFAKEITLTLLLKVILIFALWYFFFSQPVEKSLTDDKVRQQILGATQYDQSASENSSFTFQQSQNLRGKHSW